MDEDEADAQAAVHGPEFLLPRPWRMRKPSGIATGDLRSRRSGGWRSLKRSFCTSRSTSQAWSRSSPKPSSNACGRAASLPWRGTRPCSWSSSSESERIEKHEASELDLRGLLMAAAGRQEEPGALQDGWPDGRGLREGTEGEELAAINKGGAASCGDGSGKRQEGARAGGLSMCFANWVARP